MSFSDTIERLVVLTHQIKSIFNKKQKKMIMMRYGLRYGLKNRDFFIVFQEDELLYNQEESKVVVKDVFKYPKIMITYSRRIDREMRFIIQKKCIKLPDDFQEYEVLLLLFKWRKTFKVQKKVAVALVIKSNDFLKSIIEKNIERVLLYGYPTRYFLLPDIITIPRKFPKKYKKIQEKRKTTKKEIRRRRKKKIRKRKKERKKEKSEFPRNTKFVI